MIVLSSASKPPLEFLCETASPSLPPTKFSSSTSQYTDYQITDWQISPSAQLFLVKDEATGQQLVIKMLCSYRDTRYSLETLSKRQECLLEALGRNRIFTPELYIGLAPSLYPDWQQKILCIGEVMENPTKALLNEDTEYVLLMKPQDRDNRLDCLLKEGKTASCLIPLVEYIADIHNYKKLSISLQESIRWGSYDHLMHKLEHNFELLDFLVAHCNESDWVDHKELAERVMYVRKKAQENAMQDCYRRYFQLRIAQGYIRHCHGDIKSPHIWIASDGSKQAWSFNLLDAIDFNHAYNHIDILSDFAMLIADIQARTQSHILVSEMIEHYLRETNQDNEVARKVLDFYIIEKAIVGTGISILYDDEPQLGRDFLQVVENRLEL